MDKTRTLPPLVRGKVMGVLNFFVDEIKIFRNNLLLTDNFDLVLQVQWWGESLPTFLRPKKLQVQDRNYKNFHSLDSYYHLVKYEIKTTLDLFKIYLKSCERVEFCILETGQKYVIGSAFLRELPDLLNNNNKPIKIPILNYLGVVIGEVTIHINFFEIPQHKYEQSQSKINLIDKSNYLDKRLERIKEKENSRKIKSNYFTLGEKTLIYDKYSKINSQKQNFLTQLKSATDDCDFKKDQHIINSDVTQLIRKKNNDLLTGKEISMNKNSVYNSKQFSCECLPEIKTSSDSSKILYFHVGSQQSNSTVNIKNNSTKVINKFNCNSIKYKSKSKNMENNVYFDQNLCNRKIINKSKSSENLPKKPTREKKKKNQFDFKDSLFDNSFMPERLQCHRQTESLSFSNNNSQDIQSITSNESSNYRILDYLLGSDMNKDDEEIALNNFKEMSPSHNLVDSISQLCLDSSKNVQMSENGICNKSLLISLKPNHLNFDFSNPVERNYYEKFFLKLNNNADFKVAEFLNQPESRVMFDKLIFNKTPSQKNEFQNKVMCEGTNECINTDKEIKDTKINENHSISRICVSNITNSCGRCKYYKKLDELDAIIESLKHFEQKILKHDRDFQLDFKQCPNVLIE